jgi:undecaprenyl-diphosphatase
MPSMTSRNGSSATGVPLPLLIAAVVLLTVWGAMLLAGGNELDRTLIVDAHVAAGPWRTPVILLTRLGDVEVLLALPIFAAAWLLTQRKVRLALFLLGSVVAGRLLVELQKGALGRVRPEEHEHLVRVDSFAFPSGHAANSMIVYLLLALLLIEDEAIRRLAAIAAVLLSLAIGASRVLLGVHWPSDVVGGWCFGLLWVLLTLQLRRRWDVDAVSKRFTPGSTGTL